MTCAAHWAHSPELTGGPRLLHTGQRLSGPTPIPTLFWQVSRRAFWGVVTPVHCGFTHILWQRQATGRSAALGQPFMKPRDLRRTQVTCQSVSPAPRAPPPPSHTHKMLFHDFSTLLMPFPFIILFPQELSQCHSQPCGTKETPFPLKSDWPVFEDQLYL